MSKSVTIGYKKLPRLGGVLIIVAARQTRRLLLHGFK